MAARRSVDPGRERKVPVRDVLIALALAGAGTGVGAVAPHAQPSFLAAYVDSDRAALRRAVATADDADLAAAYAARAYRPIWLGDGHAPAAGRLLAALRGAADDGLDSRAYDAEGLAARLATTQDGAAEDRAALDLALTTAFARYAADLRRPARDGLQFIDPQFAPPTRPALLRALATSPDAGAALDQALRVNPLYAAMRDALRRAPPADARLIRANLERLRGLPPDLGERYVLVDLTAQRLAMVEHGHVVDGMKAVVGRPAMPTPAMAAIIRYAIYNPYWNVPPDLARASYAPRALGDPVSLERLHIEVLSDWSPQAQLLDAKAVDWQAVADGRLTPRLRQAPGPGNMMGAVKFMLPNNLGIYLHDTPERAAFGRDARLASAGCVRLEDAPRLARWLFGRETGRAGEAPEQRLDLPAATPVYILYLTAAVGPGGRIERRPDIYGRDASRARAGEAVAG